MIRKIEEFQKNSPKGCLKYQKKGKKTYFYHQIWDENSKSWERKYIKRENELLPRELAQKQYYSAIKGVLKKNVSALKDLIRQYRPEDMQEIYVGLSDVRKKLIEPLVISEEERIRQWESQEYVGNSFHSENLRFETEQGEFVKKTNTYLANGYLPGKDVIFTYETMANPLEILAIRRVVEDMLVGE